MCLIDAGALVGSVDEIMSTKMGREAHVTLRMCVDAVRYLIERKMALSRQNLKLIVCSECTSPPPNIDEMAAFFVDNKLARKFWRGRIQDPDLFPHVCPLCGGAAFIGFAQVDCRSRCEREEWP